uniref:THAP domain-containing protein 1 n=2 Tax=Cyprinus carpio TaxID=7962 RepID=A0A8C2PRQ7_CYPCA
HPTYTMVISCCAVGCANRQGKANISFYRIPFDGKRRQRWVAAISRKNWQPSKYSRIFYPFTNVA